MICWRYTGPFASNCSVCALSISTYQQKSHKGICDIRVWKSVVNASFLSDSISVLLKIKKKKHAPNQKFYEQYYVDQAMQKGRNLPAFHGARFQRCHGLGSIFKGLFRWAMPHLQQGAKMIGKKGFTNGCQCCPRYS